MTLTGKLVYEETSEDWSKRFLDGWWADSGGYIQSLLFAFHGLQHITSFKPFNDLLKWRIEEDEGGLEVVVAKPFTLHDYGCACGDGTAFLQMAFPMAEVKGFDHSKGSIEVAKKRWAHIDFEIGDVRAPKEIADIIWTSHTLEHTLDAATCVNGLLEWCQLLVVIVPLIERDKTGNHEGAEESQLWLKRCPIPVHRAAYNTLRKNPRNGQVMAESNLLFVWEGKL